VPPKASAISGSLETKLTPAHRHTKSAPLQDALCITPSNDRLRGVFVAIVFVAIVLVAINVPLNLAVFLVLDFFLVQLIGRIAYAVFHLAHRVEGLALSLLRQTFSLGFFVSSPLSNMALHAYSHVFCFFLNAFLIHG
jgi:hypothetical protein